MKRDPARRSGCSGIECAHLIWGDLNSGMELRVRQVVKEAAAELADNGARLVIEINAAHEEAAFAQFGFAHQAKASGREPIVDDLDSGTNVLWKRIQTHDA